MSRWAALALFMAAHALAAPPAPKEIPGQAARVVDGDTVLFVPDDGGVPITLRLSGLDAPEICQRDGPEAKQALEDLVLKHPLRARPRGVDSSGRMLATLWRDKLDVGDRLVRDGHAWSYRYRDDKGPYVMQERLAKALQRGVHAQPGAVLPRDFRKRNGPCVR